MKKVINIIHIQNRKQAELCIHCKKKSVKFTVKKQQPEFYRKKYGNNILGFTVLT